MTPAEKEAANERDTARAERDTARAELARVRGELADRADIIHAALESVDLTAAEVAHGKTLDAPQPSAASEPAPVVADAYRAKVAALFRRAADCAFVARRQRGRVRRG